MALVAGLFIGVVALGRGHAGPGEDGADEDGAWSGWQLYDRLCLPCHGASGDGRGPAAPWLWPRPRDLTRGVFKWGGEAPGLAGVREGLRRTLEHGAPGTSMPGYHGVLDEAARERLVDVVLALSAGVRAAPWRIARPAPALGPPPPRAVARGAELWTAAGCAACHGADGRGEGPAAASLVDATGRAAPPYDLRGGVRRPHAAADRAAAREAIARSVAAGVPGTAMPALPRPPAELWALADYVLALQAPALAPRTAGAWDAVEPLAEEAIAVDRRAPVAAGAWPGAGEPDAAVVFGGELASQGPAPATLTPAQASLSAQQCARCHAAQARQWRGSLHAGAMSPGLLAQLVPDGAATLGAPTIAACQRCHAPLAEQLERAPARPGSAGLAELRESGAARPDSVGFDEQLRGQGVTCAACHVRQWRRYGPPRVAASLAPAPGYPKTEAAIYERSDFCLPCHQLPPRQAVAGRPLLDTYREWLEGPYARRGVQCQHCHMPNREHTFLGVHDPETVRQGATLTAAARRRTDGAIEVEAAVRNAGAGHYLPTTPTPALWLTVELRDAGGRALPGASSRWRIGRWLVYRGGWRQLEDTRLAPGQALEVARSWRVEGARTVRVTLEVHPDDYYEGFYRARLAAATSPEARAAFARALARAVGSRYVAEVRELSIDGAR